MPAEPVGPPPAIPADAQVNVTQKPRQATDRVSCEAGGQMVPCAYHAREQRYAVERDGAAQPYPRRGLPASVEMLIDLRLRLAYVIKRDQIIRIARLFPWRFRNIADLYQETTGSKRHPLP